MFRFSTANRTLLLCTSTTVYLLLDKDQNSHTGFLSSFFPRATMTPTPAIHKASSPSLVESPSPPPPPPPPPPYPPPFNTRHLPALLRSAVLACALPTTPTYAHCLNYRPSNNIPNTDYLPNPGTLARTETKRRKEEASATIDDIEAHGFIIQALLGKGSFGHVYCARIISWEDCLVLANGQPICVPGDRVAIKRMSKLNLLRPIDLDEYHDTGVSKGGVDSDGGASNGGASNGGAANGGAANGGAANGAATSTTATTATTATTTPTSQTPAIRDPRVSSVDVAYGREMTALRQVGQHVNLCGLMGRFETKSAFYIVLELVEGPPLFDWIVEHGVFFRELTASSCLVQIVKALVHIHERGVCHNDLKPENIIVGIRQQHRYGGDGNPDDMEGIVGGDVGIEGNGGNVNSAALNLKIVDFGMSHVLKKKKKNNRKDNGKKGEGKEEKEEEKEEEKDNYDDYDDESIEVGPGEGTFAYWSPEMMSGKSYGRPADMWSLGVTLFIALCGIHPFDPKGVSTDQDIYTHVMTGNFDKTGFIWNQHLSDEAKEIIRGLLEIDPKKRTTAKELLNMKWFARAARKEKGGGEEDSEQESEEELKTKNEMSAIRNVLLHRTSRRLKEERRQREGAKNKGGSTKKEGGGGGGFWNGWF